MTPRIIDIAKAAAVSPSAVSLALNNRAGISEELRRRIVDLAKTMGYRFTPINHKAANGTIKLLKIAKHGHIVNERHNSFITEYLEGIDQGGKRHNCKLEISFFNKTPVEEIINAELGSQKKADGFIVLGTELSAHEFN
jgi:LacI family transcriptional regulator